MLSAAATVSAEEQHVRASLVCDAVSVEPGASFTLGVLLEPEPGWHVYWRHPGAAGLATEVVFELPEGFEIGELRWPIPVEFEQPGGIVGYGYEEPVILAAEITVPQGHHGTIPVALEASWLACRDVCVLGSARVGADLPLSAERLHASSSAFDGWEASLPLREGPVPFGVSVTGGPLTATDATDVAVWLSWPSPPGIVEFFPDPGTGLKIEDARVRSRGALTRIDLEVKRLKTTATASASLSALVVATDSSGSRRAWPSRIPLD
jgi:thiol:disulfide interchange protein DsbD